MKEIEGSTRNKSPYPDENNYLTAPIALLTYRRKTTPNEEENIYKLIQGRKFSFCSNEWKVKDFEKEHKNQSLNEENVIINNRIRENDSLKNVFSENDYISFLNLKLSKFKEYKSKQTQEKKNKNEVFSNLFEENLVKTNSKRSLQIKLKNVAETIRKKNIKNKISIDYEKLQVEKKEVINKNPLEKFFMKEEKNLNLIRNKIIKVFNNEMKVFKGVGSRSTKALSFNSNLLL